MVLKSANLKNVINLFAGVVGLTFDRIEGLISEEEEVIEPDDLTEISGIGRAFAQRLNEAGIISYSQLAELTPDQVRQITRAAQWQGDPAEWIAEARNLAST